MKKADLSPPLGWMGGPCKVVQRIEDEVRSPSLRGDLAEKVEHGQKLTNPEAAKVYSIEMDKGGGMFRAIKITPHAQYRMDQRGITVGDLRVALMHFSKQLNDWKSQQAWEWASFQQDSMRGEPIEYNAKKLGNLRVGHGQNPRRGHLGSVRRLGAHRVGRSGEHLVPAFFGP